MPLSSCLRLLMSCYSACTLSALLCHEATSIYRILRSSVAAVTPGHPNQILCPCVCKGQRREIDCLHRPCSRPAPRGKIESVRTHSEVIEQFDSFSLLKLLFLVRNWHCCSRKAFPRQMTPRSREKTAKTAVFATSLTGMKSCTVDRGCTPAPKDATKLAVFFRFFRVFPSTFQLKTACRGNLQTLDLFRVKIRKMAQGSNDLSTLPLSGLFFFLQIANK